MSGASAGPSSIARARARTRSAAARSKSWRRSSPRWRRARADKTIRGLVIISAKERGFIVGADIREFADLATETEVIEKLRPVTALFDRLERLPVPVVCAINGFCLGGGLELALACHYRIATRDQGTKLGFPEVKLGIFPGFNGTARSIRLAGAPAAMQAMLTGIDAVGFGGARQ